MADTTEETIVNPLDPAPPRPGEVEDDATQPPEVEEGTGVALIDGYPANHRLRAEALVADGQEVDPHGHVSPELIADTAARLAAEDKAAVTDPKRQAAAWRAELRELEPEQLTVAAVANAIDPAGLSKTALINAIVTARAARNEG